MTRRRTSAWAPALLALSLSSGFVVARLAHFGWDASRFVNAGDRYVDATRAPSELHVARDATGYDGQFYYRLARDPFSTRTTVDGIRFDAAPARHQRIFYPLLVWALSRTHVTSVVWLMIVVNVLAYTALGLVGGLLAMRFDRNPLWGLALPLYPGFIVALALDLADVLAGLLLVVGVLCVLEKQWGRALVALCLAAFTRETTLILAIGLGAGWVVQRIWRREPDDGQPPLFVWVTPIALTALWQGTLWWIYGSHPLFAAGHQFGFPLAALGRQVRVWAQQRSPEDLFQLLEVVLVVAIVVAAERSVSRSRFSRRLMLPLAFAVLLMSGFPSEIWRSQTNFLRASAEACMLSIVIVLERRETNLAPLMIATGMATLANVGVWTGVGRF